MKKCFLSRLLSLFLILALFAGLTLPALAAGNTQQKLRFEKADGETAAEKLSQSVVSDDKSPETSEPQYAADDLVRVSIVLKDEPAIARFSTDGIGENVSAQSYRRSLQNKQDALTQRINAQLSQPIDVVWNLTLAANIISANVRYGQIDAIKAVSGVADVFVENRYAPMVLKNEALDPNMSTSSEQIGSDLAWAAGYTGAGSKVAVIDTGLDLDHQSFSEAGYNHSMELLAEEKGLTLDAYKKSVGVLTQDDISAVIGQLNINKSHGSGVTAEQVYKNDKIPFGYNYVDKTLDVTHLNDTQEEHGSHVAGIAAANAYIENADGSFSAALEKAKVQGVAPDAQLVIMKVFGKGGGAYDSDYMAAIEDAIVLGCDSVNLSLGSAMPGFSRTNNTYQAIMDGLTAKGTVVCMSAGNSGYWAENARNGGYLYGNDVSFQTGGSPGSYTDSLTVASVNNAGITGNYFSVGGNMVFFTETTYSNQPLTSLTGEHDYVLLPASVLGNSSDFEGIDVRGKIAFISRGGISFVDKATNAVNAGAAAVVIYNNAAGTINMDLSSYTKTAPCVSITQADGQMILANSTAADGGAYYTGKMSITNAIGSAMTGADYTMSDFSSWGIPGSLELKPEITAPGGNIYSVNGTHKTSGGATAGGTDVYENMSGTSMASPQVAGMAAVLGQYIRESKLAEKVGLTPRQLINSLLMSTATPVIESETGYPYSVLNQGAGLANVNDAINAESFILMDSNLSGTASDGKVKAELGDDPERTGSYTASFTIHNISGEIQKYTFSTDLFTQDIFSDSSTGYTYLDTWTTPLDAEVTYDVDGADVVPDFTCDVNRDGRTNGQDAQAILDYVAGVNDGRSYDLAAADLSHDGKVTSYDAHLLLVHLKSASVEIPVGTSIHVTVTMKLTAAQKAELDELYENGAYVEGYIYVETDNTSDGALRPAHSIPVLGFYGNWSDASMLDTSTLLEKLYGDTRPSYLGLNLDAAQTNCLAVTYPGESTKYLYTVNPYLVEDSYPTGREAINASTALSSYTYSLIRNAAALTFFVQTDDGVMTSNVFPQNASAFYYANAGSWQNLGSTMSLGISPRTLGLKEGDTFTAGLVMIPEYYEKDGTLTSEQIAELISSGTLGRGAFLANTFTVDNTAPQLLSATKDPSTGALTLEMQDNQYIAYAAVYKGTSSILLGDGQPEQSKAGETTTLTFPLDDATAGEYVTVSLCDYAGNESSLRVYYGGQPENYTGRMFGFTSTNARGSGQRWVEIDATTLSYDEETDSGSGLDTAAPADLEVYAAEYAGKYVFFASDDGIYAVPHGEWNDPQKVTDYSVFGKNELVSDMAYNAQDENLYLVTSTGTDRTTGRPTANGSKLYKLDPESGSVTKVADITVNAPSVPYGSTYNGYKSLHAMTTDGLGRFYAVNFGASYSENANYIYLYSWTLSDIANGRLTLDPIADQGVCDGTGEHGKSVRCTGYSSMTYHAETGTIYLAAGFARENNGADLDNELWTLDPNTGKASLANSGNALLYAHVTGVYVVPAETRTLTATDAVSSVKLSQSSLILMEGADYTLSADVYPWLTKDKSVTWASEDETVATVADGVVHALTPGKTQITVTSAADPSKAASCTLTVKAAPKLTLNAVIYDSDSQVKWASFNTANPEQWTVLGDAAHQYDAGALHDGKLLLHSGTTLYSVDPSTFAETTGAELEENQIWSDAAESPVVDSESDGEVFGEMVAIAGGGNVLETLTANGVTNSWTLSTFASDPMAVIAYIGEGTYDMGFYDVAANLFYVMTESGKLYELSLYEDFDLDEYDIVYDVDTRLLGDTGLKLTGVASVGSSDGNFQRASMIYDSASGYLLISAYLSGDTAVLYAVSPEDRVPAVLGTFGASVWPVVSLYRADGSSSDAAQQPVNAATGSLNAVKSDVRSTAGSKGAEKGDTVTVTISDSTAAANGKYVVSYDPDALTFVRGASARQYYALHADEKKGEITFAFASEEAVAAGTALASLKFTVNTSFDTELTITTEERGSEPAPKDSTSVSIKGIGKQPDASDIGAIIGASSDKKDFPFTDVGRYDECYDAVKYLYENDIMNGTSDTLFSPNAELTRGMVVTILYRMEGEPFTTGAKTFSDVASNRYYSKAVEWAAENDIVNGYTDGTFKPDQAVTREQLAAIIRRYADFNGIVIYAPDNALASTDVVSNWAKNDVAWAAAEGILSSAQTANATKNATRAEVAMAIYTYLTKTAK